MRHTFPAVLFLALLAADRLPAQEEAGGAAGRSEWAFAQGYYDVLDGRSGAVDLRVEYRAGPRLWFLRPWAGLEMTTDGGSFVAGGLLFDLDLPARFFLTPSFGTGIYSNGGGKDLGSPFQFRSQVELAWQFDSGGRIGLSLGHLSNGSLGDRNPGTEVLSVVISVPDSESPDGDP